MSIAKVANFVEPLNKHDSDLEVKLASKIKYDLMQDLN